MKTIKLQRVWSLSVSAACFSLVLSGQAYADGNEALGAPNIGIVEGTGFVADGVGLVDVQPGNIELTVPSGAGVEQVLLYWNGFDRNFADGGDDTITVGGTEVTGQLIGGPNFFFTEAISSTYRADITSLDLVVPGVTNVVSVGGLSFTRRSNGAGILAIVDDGSVKGDQFLVDGDDTAFINFSSPRDTTVPQTFIFTSASEDREATITMFVASIVGTEGGGGLRPTTIQVDDNISGTSQYFDNLLDGNDGPEWDTLVITANVPAGATSLTIQALSQNRGVCDFPLSVQWPCDPLPASFVWLAGGITIASPEIPRGCWFTGGQNIQVNRVKGRPEHSGGGNIYPSCSALPGDGGQWTHTDHDQELHFQAQSLTVVECGNVAEIPPGAPSPAVTVNFIRATATGIIKGVGGNTMPVSPATAVLVMEDWGEPGRNDKYTILATGGGATISLDRAALENGGNFQIHQTSCNN